MQDDEFNNLFNNSEPYLDDNGFNERLMASLPVVKAASVQNIWLARLPIIGMLLAMVIVAFVSPIAESFKQLIMHPGQWQNWWTLALMVVTLIGISLVWVSEEGLVKK